MPAEATRCVVCRSLLDEEDLFCANCGTEAPHPERSHVLHARLSTHNFTCSGCGASMSYDASAKSLRCPFCGSTKLTHQPDRQTVAPERVVPFEIRRDEAMAILRKWLGHGFWRPGDLAERALVVSMTPIYVPYWIFEARTHTYWTADTSRTPPGARGDWYPMTGEHSGGTSGLLVGASGALRPSETNAIAPFDLERGVPPEEIDLENVTYEQFGLVRKMARPLAISGLEELERQSCRHYVPGNCRNLKVNALVEGLSSFPALLPVWIFAYRYRDQVFRFVANGQTGRATGTAPTSMLKVLAAVAAVVALILLVIAFVALASQ